MAREWLNLDVYSNKLADQVLSDLQNEPVEKGEQLNLVGYSGGGQVVLNAAEKLEGKAKVDNVVLIGAPVFEVGIRDPKVTNIYGALTHYAVRVLGRGGGTFFPGGTATLVIGRKETSMTLRMPWTTYSISGVST